ncbi:MAG: long-chain-fatty-acid--CoA ligase [Gammaproteobacteria bacterium]|nr:long-chain-fatty-acid--CoA ligase [Gammaproteobacteria bacterium]
MRDHQFIFDAVFAHAGKSADDTALVFEGRATSYDELTHRAVRVGNGLRDMDIARQGRVAILTGNNDYFFEIWLGAALGNFVLTPINARLAPQEVTYILNDSGAEVLFVDTTFFGLVRGISDQLTSVRETIPLDSYPEWRDAQSGERPAGDIDPTEPMVQMYTSGTTGFPKGVVLNHSAVLACVRSMMGLHEWEPGHVALVTAPLFHTAGCAWANCALQTGGTIILLRELTPVTILNAIEKHKVTQALLVPAVIQMVLQTPECATTDFSSLKRMLYGASPIPVPVLRQAVETFGCEFEQGYGLTETVGPIAMLRPDDHRTDTKMQSCGRPVPGANIRVVDYAGRDCETGEVGEIVFSGVQSMNGYWNQPEETAKTIRDGWLHTGDAGYFDEDGYLFIHDRLKDMIVSGGENVYPAEVERVLEECPGITDVAVIGVPDERWGETVKAVVVTGDESTITDSDVIEFARQHIARFKCPTSVDFVDAIPRNPSGKILKKVLRAPYWENHERNV